MGDAWIFVAILIVALLLATPAVRRWLSSDEERQLVDPDQAITVDPVADRVRRDPPPS